MRQPTFSHGSTLGLYEALIGKSYLCDVITDSVVHSFFIERSRILLIQREHPELEDFLWQVLVFLHIMDFLHTFSCYEVRFLLGLFWKLSLEWQFQDCY
jgi:hypothetical protein